MQKFVDLYIYLHVYVCIILWIYLCIYFLFVFAGFVLYKPLRSLAKPFELFAIERKVSQRNTCF